MEQIISCGFCGRMFNTEEEIQQHILLIHSDEELDINKM